MWPRSAAMRGRLMAPGMLELLGIELAEVLWIQSLEVLAQLLGALLGGALGLGRRDVLRDRLLEQLVHDEDRRPRAQRDRDGVAGPRVDGHGARSAVHVDV